MSESNVDVVKRIYESGGKGDVATMMSLLDPDIVIHEADALPYGGIHRGHAGMGALFQKLYEVVEGFRVVPEQYFVSGNDVAARIRVLGRARATGQAIDMAVMEVWTIKDGLVTAIRPFYWDTAEFARLTSTGSKA